MWVHIDGADDDADDDDDHTRVIFARVIFARASVGGARSLARAVGERDDADVARCGWIGLVRVPRRRRGEGDAMEGRDWI